MKKIPHFLALVVCLLLTGCDDDRYIKQIQAKFDNANPTGDRGVCFKVIGPSRISYPYLSTHTPPEMERKDPYSWTSSNNDLNDALHAFAQIGFLTETLAGEERGRPVYYYDLTELGSQYYRNDDWLSSGFCFGRVKITSLNYPRKKSLFEEREYLSGKGEKHVYYNYEFDGIPDWVTQNIELLRPVYQNIWAKLKRKKGQELFVLVRYRNSKDKAMKEWHAGGSGRLIILR